MLLALSVFLLNVALILGAYWAFVVRPERRAARVLRERLAPGRTVREVGLAIVRQAERFSNLRILDQFLTRGAGVIQPLIRKLAMSGLSVTIGVIVLASIFAGLIMLILTLQLTRQTWSGIAIGGMAACIPIWYVSYSARKRLEKMEEQFPEAMDFIARSLRAGHALTTGLGMVADEIQPPLGAEFRMLYDHQNYGMPLADALKRFAERVPMLDARFFVTAVLTQRESGGNLSEVLDNLASIIRERFRIRRHVRVMSTHGRITGMTLAFLPPALGFILTIISPDHMRLLIEDPVGIQMVVAAVVLQVIGVMMIRKIIRIEV